MLYVITFENEAKVFTNKARAEECLAILGKGAKLYTQVMDHTG